MLSLPWSCVTALKLEPVGPIAPECFGLKYVGDWEDRAFVALLGTQAPHVLHAPRYAIVDPHKVRMTRDALGTLVDSPTGLRRPEKTPWYLALTSLHRGLTE